MPAQLQDPKPAGLAVNVFTVPSTPPKSLLQGLLQTLSGDGIESYQPTPDGGAILGNPSGLPRVTVNSTSRMVTVPVDTWSRAINSAFNIVERINGRIPVQSYVAAQAIFTTHFPVSGQTAADLMRERVLNHPAFALLGGEVTGTGVKVFLNGQLGTLVVEPLLTDPSMLFVQMTRTHPAPFVLPFLKSFIETMHRYNDESVRPFLSALFSQGA
jgi:hypothetical protein